MDPRSRGRGDLFHVDRNSIVGPGIGRRAVPEAFNRFGTPLVYPITQGGKFARNTVFAVSLSGAGALTQGVVLCNQPRVLDLQTRGARFIERLPEMIVDEVLARLITRWNEVSRHNARR